MDRASNDLTLGDAKRLGPSTKFLKLIARQPNGHTVRGLLVLAFLGSSGSSLCHLFSRVSTSSVSFWSHTRAQASGCETCRAPRDASPNAHEGQHVIGCGKTSARVFCIRLHCWLSLLTSQSTPKAPSCQSACFVRHGAREDVWRGRTTSGSRCPAPRLPSSHKTPCHTFHARHHVPGVFEVHEGQSTHHTRSNVGSPPGQEVRKVQRKKEEVPCMR